ncbi:hypothetical protein MMC07_006400 [Pseudocyphellaria aurata]|nr:hypothetical protein [Pseudocyphellaria aurata]
MHYSRALVLVFAGLGLASPSPSHVSLLRRDARIDPSLKLTDYTAHINLANFEERADESPERSLEKRRHIDICTASNARAGVCVAVGALTTQIALGIAGLLKSDSNAHDCTEHSAHIDNSVHWKVYAVGRNCDTTAQLNTIQGAVTKYIEEQGSNVCGVHCLKLSHGGTWQGFVTIAPVGADLDGYYCGTYNSFGNCISGGKEDVD